MDGVRAIWYEPGMMSEISLAPLIERIACGTLTPQVTLRGLSGRMRPQTGWRVHEVALSTQLFYLVLDGEIRGDSAGVSFTVGTGDLMWANMGQPLEIQASPGKEPMIYRFRLQLMEESGAVTGAPFPFRVFPAARGCESWMARIVDEVAAPGPLFEARIRGLMLCFRGSCPGRSVANCTRTFWRKSSAGLRRPISPHRWNSPRTTSPAASKPASASHRAGGCWRSGFDWRGCALLNRTSRSRKSRRNSATPMFSRSAASSRPCSVIAPPITGAGAATTRLSYCHKTLNLGLTEITIFAPHKHSSALRPRGPERDWRFEDPCPH